jgi:hypothetical protein
MRKARPGAQEFRFEAEVRGAGAARMAAGPCRM